jgi:uncharacterized protein YndB with AHSA1/START domain
MLRTVVWILGSLVSVIAIIAIIGWLLPVGHVASRSAVVAAPPQAVFDTITDVETFPVWWKDISRVEMLPPENGRARFRQHSSTGAMVMEVIERTPPSRFVTRIADPDQQFGGTWTWEIGPEGAGSRLTITERGEVYNPIFRFISRFIFGHTTTIDSCLAALQSRLSAR